MKLKDFISSYSNEFKTNHLFLINKEDERTEMLNPNPLLIDSEQEIDSWNVQIINEHKEDTITIFIYLK